jgi:hypothetical protein
MKLTCTLCLFAGVLLIPIVSQACLIDCSITIKGNDGTYVKVGATDVVGIVVDEQGNPWFEFALPANTGGESVIDKLLLRADEDPEVGIEFGIRAGSTDTTYNILSGVVSFTAFEDAVGFASAGITLTDRAAAGATITGLFDEGKAHQARYNGTSVFANLVSSFGITGNTKTAFERKPAIGDELISGTVTSIESEFWFTLSANDSASGTSTFSVIPIPEPATLVILGLGLAIIGKIK